MARLYRIAAAPRAISAASLLKLASRFVQVRRSAELQVCMGSLVFAMTASPPFARSLVSFTFRDESEVLVVSSGLEFNYGSCGI